MSRIVFVLLLFVASAANARNIYPIAIGGIYASQIKTARQLHDAVTGLPLEPPTRSVALVLDLDGAEIGCTNTTSDMLVTITYTVPNYGDVVSARAVAYPFPDCGTGTESPRSIPSDNSVFWFFNPPGTPEITDPDAVEPSVGVPAYKDRIYAY